MHSPARPLEIALVAARPETVGLVGALLAQYRRTSFNLESVDLAAAPADEFEAISRDRFIVGSPDTVIQQIQRFQAAFRFDHLICRLYFPGLPHVFIMEELRLLAREVMPAFR